MLSVYSLGLAVPFLLTAIGLTRFLLFYSRFRSHLRTVELMSGIFLVVMGALIMVRRFALLSSYLGFLQRFSW
jgi:cytochrome c-type biogenesis protein